MQKKTVLIVDNLDMNREILTDILGENSYNFIYAHDGEEAIEKLTKSVEEIDLLLFDVVMPRLDGFGVLEKMNELKIISKIPVVMISSETSFDVIGKAYSLGITEFITRETDADTIKTKVEDAINLFGKSQEEIIKNKGGFLTPDEFGMRAKTIVMENKNAVVNFAMLYIDIKKPNLVNVRIKDWVTERTLRFFTDIIVRGLREAEICCRVKDDTLFVLKTYENKEELSEYFDEIEKNMESFFNMQEYVCLWNINAGVYLFKDMDYEKAEITTIVQKAKTAHSSKKGKEGSACLFYDEEIWHERHFELAINSEVENAIEEGQIKLYYQPQYNYARKQIVGAEVFCRWNHKEFGEIDADVFVPILEKSGKITLLDKYVCEQVCVNLKRWKNQEEFVRVPITVNISRFDFQNEDMYRFLTNLVQKYAVFPSLLRLEITESTFEGDSRLIAAVVKKLRKYGFVVAMDDFYSAATALNTLKGVDVDLFKMNIHIMDKGKKILKSERILSSIVHMSSEMDIPVVAENVETLEEAKMLEKIGCIYMQGYFFSRPMSIENFEIFTSIDISGGMDSDVFEDGENKQDFVNPLKYGCFRVNSSGVIIDADEGFEKITGYSLGECTRHGLKHTDLIPVEDKDAFEEKRGEILDNNGEAVTEHRIQKKDGSTIFVFSFEEKSINGDITIRIIDMSKTTAMLWQAEVIKRSNDARMSLLAEVAKYDELTGVFRRKAYVDKVDGYLKRGVSLAFVMLDIDKFKGINDNYGHSVGDEALKGLAKTLTGVLREKDYVCRMGGDEFSFVLADVEDENAIRSVMARIRERLRNLVFEDTGNLHFTISAGGFVYNPYKGRLSFEELYNLADEVLYLSKETGRDRYALKYDRESEPVIYTED